MLIITKIADKAGLVDYNVSGFTEVQRQALNAVHINPKAKISELAKTDLVTAQLINYNFIAEGYYLTLLGDGVLKACDKINHDVAPDFKVTVANCAVLKPEKNAIQRAKEGNRYGAFDI